MVHIEAVGYLVGDEQYGHARLELIGSAGQLFRGPAIQARGRLIEYEYLRLAQHRPRNGYALLLSAGQSHTMLADNGVVALREPFDEVVHLRQATGLDDLGKTGVGTGGNEVFVQGAGEKPGLLGHHAIVLSQFIGRDMAKGPPVDVYAPPGGLVQAEQQPCQGALATTRRAGQQGQLAGLQYQVEIFIKRRTAIVVTELQLLHLHSALAFARPRRLQGLGFTGRIHDVAQALHRDTGLLKLLPQAGQPEHGLGHAARKHLECNQHAYGKAVIAHDQQGARA